MAFRDLDWDGLKQIQQLLTERTRTRFTYQERSPTFALVEKRDLYQFLEAALLDEVAAEVNFRQWVRMRSRA